ncbi:low temperature requirement protein A [Winogradskya humida]|uniref:Low temperature requirement protein A n=1 Tax=Winogradskya humida TaxID=113566 RepID=A0ABQ4A2A7_9ACTN|nr:low temperature requirement protein A [Actinoplanes humidus]GIE24978.1 low temperature requirement protein A [Actinoplanes humidus]
MLVKAVPTSEQHRATPLELFFDVVFVFAFIQVTHLVAAEANLLGVLHGLAVFGVLWWAWASYAWLANQLHVGQGIGRLGILAATVLMVVVTIAIPEAFHGRTGPLVFATGFIAVTLVYTVVTFVAAGSDIRLRRQVLRTMGATILPVSAALVAGAMLGGIAQLVLWLGAVVIEGVTVRVTSRGGAWRLPSASHFAERHQLVVILALGESIISIGSAASTHHLTAGVLSMAVLAVALSVTMWWAYFSRLAPAAEQAVAGRAGESRATLATAGTYLHAGIVGGILLVAVGLATALHGALGPIGTATAMHGALGTVGMATAMHGALGVFGAATLGGGLALYLVMTALYERAMTGRAAPARWIAAVLATLLIPALAALPVIPAPHS